MDKAAPEIFLSPTSFLSMAVSAAEVYPRETVGILIGLRGEAKLWVEYAVPVQTADRGRDSVSWKPSVEQSIKQFMTGSTGLEEVGIFHSHPFPQRKFLWSGMNELSQDDLKSWNPKDIELVVGLVKNGGIGTSGDRLNWAHLSRGSVQGSIGEYAIRITAWYSPDYAKRDPRIAFIRCPFATGMHR